MSKAEFKRQMAIASKLVASWPVWKQRLLEQSSKPFVEKPREPVMSRRARNRRWRTV